VVTKSGEVTKEQRAQDDSRDAADEHHSKHSVVDLASPDLEGDNDCFDDYRIGKRGSDADDDRHVQKEDEQRRCNRAGSNAGDCDDERDDEA
jgi:hypothetical protein